MLAEEKDSRPLFPLTVICDADACARAGWALVDFAESCLLGGARFLQIRSKHQSGHQLLQDADAIVRLAHEAGAIVIVNDRADIARLAGADGVHVGQDDLSPLQARAVAGPSAVVGLSTHTMTQLEGAVTLETSLNYVALGPVFGTRTKDTGYDAVGLTRVRAAAQLLAPTGLPLVAIGGMTLERVRATLDAGAHAVAVIGDLFAEDNPQARVGAYLAELHRASKV